MRSVPTALKTFRTGIRYMYIRWVLPEAIAAARVSDLGCVLVAILDLGLAVGPAGAPNTSMVPVVAPAGTGRLAISAAG